MFSVAVDPPRRGVGDFTEYKTIAKTNPKVLAYFKKFIECITLEQGTEREKTGTFNPANREE